MMFAELPDDFLRGRGHPEYCKQEESAMVRLTTSLLIGAALVLPALAQDEINAKLAGHWKTSKKYMIALAEQMPAADYSFKPNAAEMSFGEQMAHIAGANSFFFATLSGQKDPIAKPANFEKATVLKML